METVQLIIQVLILLGIFYVAFIQDRVTKVKDSLWETLKDYPDIAERRFTWKEEEIKKEAEQKVKEVVAKLDLEIRKREKSHEVAIEWFSEILGVLMRIFVKFGYQNSKNFLVFRDAIEDAKDKNIREGLYGGLDYIQDYIQDKIKEQKK